VQPRDTVAAAHERLAAGGVRGRIVLETAARDEQNDDGGVVADVDFEPARSMAR